MTTGLLGDTSFLDTLQQASQVLNDRVSSSPFGNYTPNQASDYVVGPLGGIAQNKFMGDQFQTPNPFNAPYIPEAFNASSVLNAASTSPFNYNFGSYTPGAFNQFYGSPMTSPAMATTTTRTGGGGGRDRMGPGVSTEFAGDRGFRINADGSVSMLDEDSLDYKFNNFMKGLLSATPGSQLSNLFGQENVYDRLERKYGENTAQEFMKLNAEAINKELMKNPEARRLAVEKGFLSTATQEQKDRLAMSDEDRGIRTYQTDPSRVTTNISTLTAPTKQGQSPRGSNRSKLGDRAAAGQAGKKAGKLGKGQYGGR
tara:strand:+ start:1352 stop:2290 length:939 start_codon:yes stop_codon:yes gene_type:complete